VTDDPEKSGARPASEDPSHGVAEEAEAQAAARESRDQAERAIGESFAATVKEDVREAEARKAEEATAEAHKAEEQAHKDAEKAEAEERAAKERAEAAAEEARRAREQATGAETHARETQAHAPPAQATAVSAASVTGPGVGDATSPRAAAAARADATASPGGLAQPEGPSGEPNAIEKLVDERPEVAVGIAFAGAFLLAQILKRIAN